MIHSDLSYDDALAISDFERHARELFPVQLLGSPTAFSEFGVAYTTFSNGYRHDEGAEPVIAPLEIAIGRTLAAFRDVKEQGFRIIVWRMMPSISRHEGRTYFRLRCHFLTLEEFATATEKLWGAQ